VPQLLYPFPYHEFQKYVRGVKDIIIVELSYSAQFYKYLQTFLELPEGHTFLFKRSGGKNLTVGEVEERLAKVQEMGKLRREVLV
jgi:pyruvate/2-oxoacid:ferredoxin oxidoreductase alpha subunit